MFNVFTNWNKSTTNPRLSDENYTSFVVSLLFYKIGGGKGVHLFEILVYKRGAYLNGALI